jgi:hypothetical protein
VSDAVIRKMKTAIHMAKRMAAHISPGSESMSMPQPGRPVPLQHDEIPAFANGGKAVRKALSTAKAAPARKEGKVWSTVIAMPHPKMRVSANPTRLVADAEGPGGVKGIVFPRHIWEGGNGKGGVHISGMAEVNEARAKVYGAEERKPTLTLRGSTLTVVRSTATTPWRFQSAIFTRRDITRTRGIDVVRKTPLVLDTGCDIYFSSMARYSRGEHHV